MSRRTNNIPQQDTKEYLNHTVPISEFSGGQKKGEQRGRWRGERVKEGTGFEGKEWGKMRKKGGRKGARKSRAQKKKPKPKDRTNSTKEFSDQFEGTTQ